MGAHTPGMHPNRALSGGRRNGFGTRGTFATVKQESRDFGPYLSPAGTIPNPGGLWRIVLVYGPKKVEVASLVRLEDVLEVEPAVAS